MDDLTRHTALGLPSGGLPGDYARLAYDQEAKWGHKPVISGWRQTNASRYVRMFQSRRSLLAWLWNIRT